MTGRANPIARMLAGACVLLLTTSADFGGAAEPESSDIVLQALKEELARSMQLKLESLEKPYYIAYGLTDVVTLEFEASLGAIVAAPEISKFRWLRPEVRVGNYEFDNSEFLGRRSFFGFARDFARPVVIEEDLATLRHDVWLATDEAYKEALEQYAQKRSALKNRVERDQVPDFSKESPAVSVSPLPADSIDAARWRETVRKLSAIFREYPGIQESSVKLRLALGKRYLVNSEGTAIRQPLGIAILSAHAATQAADGMPLRHFAGSYAKRLDGLPPEKELAAAVRRIAEELTKISAAAPFESYSGPVLFSGQAAAELFFQVLVPQLSGHRPPVFEQEEMAEAMLKNDLVDRLNRPVLPSFLSVVDDPTQDSFRGVPLVGAYTLDDQGVRVTPVTLIDNGILKTLLMSRRPRKEIGRSNGHGRAMSQGSAGAVIGNLFVRAAEGRAIADPKSELIRLCREQGLKWGLWIRLLDQPGLSGGSSFPLFPMRRSPSLSSLTAPLVADKVFVDDGHEERVRGLVPGEISIRALRDIVAAGEDDFVHNRATMTGGGLMGMMAGFGADDDGGRGIPVTVIAPSVLIRELEFKAEQGSRQKTPVLPSPLKATKARTR